MAAPGISKLFGRREYSVMSGRASCTLEDRADFGASYSMDEDILYLAPAISRNALKLTGLYWRALRNAERIIVRRNDVRFAALPALFDRYTILQISDLHVDMNEVAM